MNNYNDKDFGCPVMCKYCAVTKIDKRRKQWNEKTLIGLNASVTIINPPPVKTKDAMKEFYELPAELFMGDRLGFNAISDPFWPKYEVELRHFLKTFAPVAKILTAVTKFPIPDRIWKLLSKTKNFRLVVSITGLDGLEKVSTKSKLRVLQQAKKYGVLAFPIIHPYISGLSDLSFLPKLRKMGYEYIGIKGLRYNSRTMNDWMPVASRSLYEKSNEDEVLPDDGWKDVINESGMRIMDLREWYDLSCPKDPKISFSEAKRQVTKVLSMANITSSRSDVEVRDSAIKRRM